MEKIYKYRLGKFVLYSSMLHILLFVVLGVVVSIFTPEGGYILAWFCSLILAVLALMTLSIPRRVVVDDEGIEIQCLAEDTTFTYQDIAHIRKVKSSTLRSCLPLFGAVGFFGYYGRFFNLRTMEVVYIYASRWDKFVEITDTEGRKYYISCEEQEDIIERVEGYINHLDTQENI